MGNTYSEMKPSNQKHRRVLNGLQNQQKKRDFTKQKVSPIPLLHVGVCAFLSLISGTVVGLGLFGASTASAGTGINQEMSFEGKIVTSAGLNIPDGTYNMEFKIYSGCTNEPTNNTGCTLAWTEDYLVGQSDGVTFTSGTYAVNLGQYCPLSGGTCTPSAANDGNTSSGVNWNSYPLYLSLQIGNTSSCSPSSNNFQTACGGDGEMNPYVLLTSSPYAFNANELGGMTSSQFGQLAANQTWTGTNTFQAATTVQTASATALQVESGTTPLLTVDTSDNVVRIGHNAALSSTPAYIFLGDAPSNSGGNALITGQWESPNSWGIGPNSNSGSDNGLRIGVMSTNNGNSWNNSSNLNLVVTGTEKIQPTTGNDSATAFQVLQNTSGTNVFTVDSLDGEVLIGTGNVGESTPKILVLDSGTSASDPTGVNGAMYYNASLNKFRCYQNGAWYDCLGGGSEYARKYPFLSTDFLGAIQITQSAPWGYCATSGGTEVASNNFTTINHPGQVVIHHVATSGSGGGMLMTCGASNVSMELGGGESYELVFNLDSLANTSMRLGFWSGIDATTAVANGVYMDINASGVLTGKTANTSLGQSTTSSYTLSTATWYRAKIVVNSAGNGADYYLYNDSGQIWHDTLGSTDFPASTTVLNNGVAASQANTTATDTVDLDYMAFWETRALTR